MDTRNTADRLVPAEAPEERKLFQFSSLAAFSVHVREHQSQYTQVYTDGLKDPEHQSTVAAFSDPDRKVVGIKRTPNDFSGHEDSTLGSALGGGK